MCGGTSYGQTSNPSVAWKKWTFSKYTGTSLYTYFGIHSDISAITEQPYNEGLIHRKYKQWEPCL